MQIVMRKHKTLSWGLTRTKTLFSS